MCGIGLVLVCGTPIKADEGMLIVSDGSNSVSIDDIGHAIAPRGPDKLNVVSVSDDLTLTASLLALRGKPTPQPISSEEHFLCWNGQVFGDEQMFEEVCHTVIIHKRLQTRTTQNTYSSTYVTKHRF
jgi:asparagine synthetase B (glutamine-hydrolysing)